jgi:DNA-directed RNA polymerase subunit beta
MFEKDWPADIRERWDKGEDRTPTREDFIEVLRYMLKLRKGVGETDDIDHLGNRRVRSVGELARKPVPDRPRAHGAGDQGKDVGLSGNDDRHAERPDQSPSPSWRPFRSSSEARSSRSSWTRRTRCPKSRTSAACRPWGPGGLSRERAGFEVRDVHPTHYGRICPIETPEGPNIGLISSLSCFAQINDYGFIESPYRKVEKGQVVDYVRIIRTADGPVQAARRRSRGRVREGRAAPDEGREERRPRPTRTRST